MFPEDSDNTKHRTLIEIAKLTATYRFRCTLKFFAPLLKADTLADGLRMIVLLLDSSF